MPGNRAISQGLFCAALLGTIVCMALSAAAMVDATFMVFDFTMIFVLFGFIFAMLNAQDEKALAAKRLQAGSPRLVEDAIRALEEYENAPQANREEKRARFVQTAVRAVIGLGEISVAPKTMAMASTAKAVDAFLHLQTLCEACAQSGEIEAARRRCEEFACMAIYDIRRMRQKADGVEE